MMWDTTINAAAAAARVGIAAAAVAAAVLVAGWDAGKAWWTVWTEAWRGDPEDIGCLVSVAGHP